MADKTISQLTAASSITASDLFVLEQSGTAKKLTGQILENWLVSYADGHGGIQSVAKTATSGLVDTYTITYADTNTSTFTVTNGAKGDTGSAAYVYIRYSAVNPTQNSDMTTVPDKYIGICVTTSNTAPTAYTSYTWYLWKGSTGDAATVTSSSVKYQVGPSTGAMPTGTWVDLENITNLNDGDFLWSKTDVTYNNNTTVTTYGKSRQGVDGTGTPGTNTPLIDEGSGSVGTSTAFAREDHVHPEESIVTLSVGSSDDYDIKYNTSNISTVNRAYARKIGNLCIFSFVATLTSGNKASNAELFTVKSAYRPNAQVDFLLLHSNDGVVNGQFNNSSYPGVINSYASLTGGSYSVRAEIIWVIEST